MIYARGESLGTRLLQWHEKECGDFAETTAFERYGVKTGEKANMHNQHWLTATVTGAIAAILSSLMTEASKLVLKG